MWRANGNPNPCTDLDKKICTSSPEGRFWWRFDSPPPPPWSWGPKALRAEGHIFENYYQNKRCSAGCKLTRAAPGTSAS